MEAKVGQTSTNTQVTYGAACAVAAVGTLKNDDVAAGAPNVIVGAVVAAAVDVPKEKVGNALLAGAVVVAVAGVPVPNVNSGAEVAGAVVVGAGVPNENVVAAGAAEVVVPGLVPNVNSEAVAGAAAVDPLVPKLNCVQMSSKRG